MSEYYNVTTNAGDAAIATAIANNNKLNITHVAFGDGNGSVPTPNKTRSALVHEVHRQAVTKYSKHPTVANYIVIETIIPSSVGGFWIREMGMIADNVLISHGSHAPFYKVADPEGVSEYRLKFTQDVRDGSVVEIVLDESLIYASQEWVNKNYIRRNELVDNLTSNDATKPLTAKQGKKLQDEKFDKSGGTITGNVRQPVDNSQFTFGNDEDFGFIKKNGSKAKIAIGANTKFEIAKSDKDKISFEDNLTTLLTLDQSGVLWCPGGFSANSASSSKLQTARTISYSGAATGSFSFDGSTNVSCLLTLANSGVSAGTYSSRTQIPTITVNSKGLITSISQQSIPFATKNQFGIVQLVDDLNTDDSSRVLTARQGKILQDGKFDKTGGTVSGNIKTTGSLEVAQTLSVAGLVNFAPQNQGAHISWNRNGGQGRTDFINHQGQSGGGFDFWNGNGDAYNLVVTIDASGNYSGNAASASKLQTLRKIGGVDFDGTRDIVPKSIENTGRFPAPAQKDIPFNTGLFSVSQIYDNGYPVRYGNVLNIGGAGVSQIAVGWTGGIFHRGASDISNQWSDWLEIAYIDSNVASATKLKNSRSLWGNNFDGTADTNGTLNFGDAGNRKILIKAETVTDGGYIAVGNQGQDRGYIEIGTTDDENTEIWAAQRRGENGDIVRLARLLDESGNTSFPGNISASSFQLTTAPGDINKIAPGNGDGASYDTHNLVIRSWWGIGFRDFQDKCRIFIDTRTGDLKTKGKVEAGYITTEGNVNAGNAVTTKNVVASIDVKAEGWMYATKYVGKDGGGSEFVGNASSASKLATARNIALSGAVSGNANFDGSGNITINTTANNAIGVDQSWQVVTSSRARETTYFNSTGKPIQVLVSFPDSNNGSPRIQVLVDNLTIINHQYDSGGSYGSGQYSFIVPSGQTYRVNTPFGAVDPILWTELR